MPNLYTVTVRSTDNPSPESKLVTNFTKASTAKAFASWVRTQRDLVLVDESPAYSVAKSLEDAQVTLRAFIPKPPPKMVERANFMTGEKFMESEDTNYYASPRSETYWSS